MSTIGSEFKGLPIAYLISAPLTAACDAQILLANATADFIKVIGFEPPAAGGTDPNAVGDPRTVSFTFTRPTPARDAIPGSPAIPATSTTAAVPAVAAVAAVPAGTETIEIKVPTLAIAPIPALSIKSVNIVFDMEVKTASASKSSQDEALSARVDASAKWGAVKVAVSIQGTVSSHKEQTSSTDTSAKYHVEVIASDTGGSDGMRRVLDTLNSAIVPVAVPA